CVLACARHFRLLRGVRRAALASVYPRQLEQRGQDPLALLLDVGATVRCEAEELVHFALMGSAYARRVSKVVSPAVGLLNMGTEETKGGEVLVEAHRRLRQLPVVNFVGNVEGNDLVRGRADVIVCEGLLGNVALKLIEGVSEVLYDVTGRAGERRVAWRLGLRLLSRGSERARALTDYTQYGGSPILGFEHVFIKCRGRSGALAVANAVKVAAKAVRDHVPREIADALAAARRGSGALVRGRRRPRPAPRSSAAGTSTRPISGVSSTRCARSCARPSSAPRTRSRSRAWPSSSGRSRPRPSGTGGRRSSTSCRRARRRSA